MSTIAIIPARSGSKGIPGKNIAPLLGHPLIAYSIAASLASHSISRTIVSTDSEEIAEIARRYGAEVPFLRQPEPIRRSGAPLAAGGPSVALHRRPQFVEMTHFVPLKPMIVPSTNFLTPNL